MVATLLVADAWFDVTTSATAADATQALILALLVELPAAAFPSTWRIGLARAYANGPIPAT